jgi:radical SAM superfamily enzyme with C-terminal helix-hairpin-helix motif
MRFTILDCYTDEPAGLGVPPYLGTYPRYVAGAVLKTGNEVIYLTIDDLRFYAANRRHFKKSPESVAKLVQEERQQLQTNIKIKNLSKNIGNLEKILKTTDILVVIAGVHTPGKYLAAQPGTTKEAIQLVNRVNFTGFVVLTGPAMHLGSGLYGGKIARDVKQDFDYFDLVAKDLEFKIPDLLANRFAADVEKEFTYQDLDPLAVAGAQIVKEHPDYPDFVITEIETSKGCPRRPGCSFCTEPLKANIIERRQPDAIIREMKALASHGVQNFRLGKQSCFYSYSTLRDTEKLLRGAHEIATVLHIDNANPNAVTVEKTKLIVKYCTEGNIAAFGVESFDRDVIKANYLNSDPETTYKAIQILNTYGAGRGPNGMPKLLPGINILFGLNRENKKTHERNMYWLKKILDDGLLIRRINIRQVVIFPKTFLSRICGDKYLRKNKEYYWKWRNEIRQEIDAPMLKRLLPVGSILKQLRTEIYDGNTTFARQVGTYPLIVGIKERLDLDQFIDVRVVDHMLRSIVGEPVA